MKKGFELRVRQALEAVPLPEGVRPQVGIILGSGLGAIVERFEGTEIPYDRIPGLPVPTVAGHRGLLKVGPAAAVCAGRFHYYEGHELEEVTLTVFLLHGLGARTLIVTNAAGGINRRYRPGELVLLRDHLNLLAASPLRGPALAGGARFPDLSEAYSPRLRAVAREAAGRRLREGVYAALPGPAYETPAEIRMLRRLGADLVGMSTVPEVIAARALGMEVLGVSCVTNMAAGILPQPLSHQEVIETGRKAEPALERLLLGVVRQLGRDARPRQDAQPRQNADGGP